ncbi:hypothetical protein M0802_006699 [Mischocyttarus mexicanus]|nr:hypothetical protein M0802_006699 [Mischocyttarus mexicanus]
MEPARFRYLFQQHSYPYYSTGHLPVKFRVEGARGKATKLQVYPLLFRKRGKETTLVEKEEEEVEEGEGEAEEEETTKKEKRREEGQRATQRKPGANGMQSNPFAESDLALVNPSRGKSNVE